MSSMHLDNIHVKSLVNPHADISPDMPIFAQLILDGKIVKQSETITPEVSGDSWKLQFDYKMPPEALMFSVAILRRNLGTRLLGHAEIMKREALTSQQQKKPVILQLNNVNPDGPSLELRASFSVSGSQTEESSFSGAEIPIQLGPVDDEAIAACLWRMMTSTIRTDQLPSDAPELDKMHERLLLLPTTNECRAPFLHFLGNIGRLCYDTTHAINDLHQAICAYEDAVRDDPGVVTYLTDLGNALSHRFKRLGDLVDIDKSVAVLRAARELSPTMGLTLVALGNSLYTRFDRLVEIGDIAEAILVFKEALTLPDTGATNKVTCLHNIGSALSARFQRLGDLSDINESLLVLEEAANVHPVGHPQKPASLAKFALSLHLRFEHLGDLSDLDHSVSVSSEAVRLSLAGEEKSYSLLILGSCLQSRFERLGELDDLNRLVSVHQEAITSCPYDQRAQYLNGLGISLGMRFERLYDPGDLNEAVVMFKEAASFVTDNDFLKPLYLTNLGQARKTLFLKSGNLSDLNDAISNLTDAVHLCADYDPRKASLLLNFAAALHTRFRRTESENDYKQVIDACASAACSKNAPTSDRFRAAVLWAQHPQRRKLKDSSGMPAWDQVDRLLKLGWESAEVRQFYHDLTCGSNRFAIPIEIFTDSIPAYTIALELLPELSWLGLSLRDRHHRILAAGKVVRDAVATAIRARQYGKAVQWLEQGRSVSWGQILKLRNPVEALKQSHPGLADKLILLSTELEDTGTRNTSLQPDLMGQRWEPLQSSRQRYHEAAHTRGLLLKEIRALPNFDRFLLPSTMAELSLAAERGPVVILIVSGWGTSALALMPGMNEEVLSIPLLNFTIVDAQALEASLRTLLRDNGRGERLVGKQEGKMAPEAKFAQILSELWQRVAKPVLEGIGYTTPPKDSQRIWWCMTGPLAFLPIHAAGLYGDDDGFGSKLSDFFISSYTPSLTALIEAFRAGSNSQPLQLLVVAQPSAHRQHYIPGTQKEIGDLQRLAQATNPQIPVLRFEGNAATPDSVRKGMMESHWVHFACHGVQDASNPAESALLIAGSSRLTLSEIIKMNLPHAQFAFLSACQTATGARELEEESIHLAAGILTAGYRSVIATMWSIEDDDAPKVATDVYEHLFKTSPPDPTRAAEALHLAVRNLQNGSGKKSFFHWVPFIHVGA
ncbi:CHAT domain-containing protein [Mycena galopus ATCC 62051]|nr:CHAT domain-containing protein [Mycena galopus ATCC 62051]